MENREEKALVFAPNTLSLGWVGGNRYVYFLRRDHVFDCQHTEMRNMIIKRHNMASAMIVQALP